VLCSCVFCSIFSSYCVVLFCVLSYSCFVLFQALFRVAFHFFFFFFPFYNFFLSRVLFSLNSFVSSFFFLTHYFCLALPLLFGVLHFVYCLAHVVCCFMLMLATLLYCVPCMQLLCTSTYCFMPIVSHSPLVALHFLSNISFAIPSPLLFHYFLFYILLPIACLVC
jgi:hypothetical protein